MRNLWEKMWFRLCPTLRFMPVITINNKKKRKKGEVMKRTTNA
jgi:hypothetical protein